MARRGEAIYHRKDGLWEARYVKEVDLTGKKKYGSVYGHSYREAKQKRQIAMDQIVLYQKVQPSRRTTVSDLAQEWLLINKQRLKVSSYQRYEGFLKNHIIPHIGNTSVIYLTTANIHRFALERLEFGLAPQSVNSVLVVLHSILQYGHRQYNLPVPEIIYLSCQRKEMRVLSQDEQNRLTAYLLDNLDICKLAVLVALYTGLRIGELCGLQWDDIGIDSIKVRRTVQRLKNADGTATELVVGPPKTDTSLREIPVPSFLMDIISTFRKNATSTYFLSLSDGSLLEPRNLQYKFQKYLKNAGVDKANFHALRHTFATRCVESGFEIKSLSEILGHSNVQTTLNRYVHSSFALKKTNMELLKLIW